MKKIYWRFYKDFQPRVQFFGNTIGQQHVENLSNWSAALEPAPVNVEKSWDLTFDALNRFKFHLHKYDLEFEIIYLPYQETISEVQKKLRFETYKLEIADNLLNWGGPAEKIKHWASQQNILFHDLSNYFRSSKNTDKIYFDLDGHLTAFGHDLLLQYVKKHILQKKSS